MIEFININKENKTILASELYKALSPNKKKYPYYSSWINAIMHQACKSKKGNHYKDLGKIAKIYSDNNLSREYELSISFAKQLCLHTDSPLRNLCIEELSKLERILNNPDVNVKSIENTNLPLINSITLFKFLKDGFSDNYGYALWVKNTITDKGISGIDYKERKEKEKLYETSYKHSKVYDLMPHFATKICESSKSEGAKRAMKYIDDIMKNNIKPQPITEEKTNNLIDETEDYMFIRKHFRNSFKLYNYSFVLKRIKRIPNIVRIYQELADIYLTLKRMYKDYLSGKLKQSFFSDSNVATQLFDLKLYIDNLMLEVATIKNISATDKKSIMDKTFKIYDDIYFYRLDNSQMEEKEFLFSLSERKENIEENLKEWRSIIYNAFKNIDVLKEWQYSGEVKDLIPESEREGYRRLHEASVYEARQSYKIEINEYSEHSEKNINYTSIL